MSQSVAQIIDNTKKAFESIDKAKKAALKAIGATAVNHAREECPVKTGTLRRSIGYEISEAENAVYIGTNVEYAPYVEFDETKYHKIGNAHFLRNAATQHNDEYKELANNIVRNA